MPRLSMTILAFAIFGLFPGSTFSATLSANEKLYAELAAFPAVERAKRIEDGAKKEGAVQLQIGFSGADGRNLIKLLQDRFPAVKVSYDVLQPADSANRFVSESIVGRHMTDVLTLSVAETTEIMQHNLAARYTTPLSDKILPQYRTFIDPEARWTPWIWSEHGIAYNTHLVKPEDAPKSYFDLCKPIFKGMVSLEPLENRFLIGMNLILGEERFREWLECLGKNDPIIMLGHTTRLTLMLAGDHSVMAENYLYRGTGLAQKDPKKAPFKAVYEAEVMGYANVGIISQHAPHPHAAAMYVDWTLGEEAQKYMGTIGRGTLSTKHPYMPDDAKLVLFGYETPETVKRLADYWVKYVGNKR